MGLDVEGTYLRYGPMVLRRCRKLLREDSRAEDAMQEVFVSLLRHEERLDDSALAGLLLRVATNVCLNKLRTERRHPEERDELLERIAAASDEDGAHRHGDDAEDAAAVPQAAAFFVFLREIRPPDSLVVGGPGRGRLVHPEGRPRW